MKKLLFFLLMLPILLQAQKPEVVVTTGHVEDILCIAIAPNGSMVASGGIDKAIKLWDVPTGREYRAFENNSGRPGVVAFHPERPYVAALFDDDFLKVWNHKTGEELYKVEAEDYSSFGFCNGGNAIAYVNTDYAICVLDLGTGAISVIKENLIFYSNTFFVLPDGKRALYSDMEGKTHVVRLSDGEEVAVFETTKDIMVNRFTMNEKGNLFAGNFADNSIRVWDVDKQKLVTTFKGHTTRLWDLRFISGDEIVSADMAGQTKIWNVQNQKVTLSKAVNYMKGEWALRGLTIHPNRELFLGSERMDIVFFDRNSGDEVDRLHTLSSRIMKFAYDQHGKYLVTSHIQSQLGLKVWNLKQNKLDRIIPLAFFPVAISPDARHVVGMGATMKLGVWDLRTGEKVKELDTEGELIQNISFSRDGKYLSGGGFNAVVKVWDMESGKLTKKFTGHTSGIYDTEFSPDGKYLASASMDPSVKVWNFENGELVATLEDENMVLANSVAFSEDGKLLAAGSWDKKVRVWNTSNWTLNHEIEAHTSIVTAVDFSSDGKYLVSSSGNNTVSEADNSLRILDPVTGKQLCRLQGHTNIINDVVFEDNSNLMFSAGTDGKTIIWDGAGCKQIATLIAIGEGEDFIITTEDNYYMASKGALEGVAFRIEDKLYPFEQFDLRLNRPDVVASRIGKTPQTLVEAYEAAYQKRLKKMNFTEDMLGDDFHIPEITILTEDIPLIVKTKEISFDVKVSDNKYELDRVNVYVNDVPIYGVNGINLRDEHVQDKTLKVTVPLLKGKNKVQVSTLNVKGAESLKETFEVIRDTEEEKDLYIISIGVSEYKDGRFQLTYPVKDATDFEETLKKTKVNFKEIHTKTLKNEDVTIENIRALKEYLKDVSPEDIVVIFIAGHGVLDENMDYYFGTYDMDFNDPSKRGLKYEELEQLLDFIKALRKLLVMDTCHSGEVDKEETELALNTKTESGTIKFRSSGVGVRQKEGLGLINTFELMNTVFADLRKGTGATVVSSAGGAEYAMEGDQWNNGLFTYCFLNGLKGNKADQNSDGKVMMSELKQYVHDQVELLSGGKQRPTSRIENISMDFQIW